MKNFVFVFLLFALLLFGGKTYLEHRYSRLLNEQSVLLSSSAAISHEETELFWDGSLLINNLRVQAIQEELTFHIGQVRVSSAIPFKTVLDLQSLFNGSFDQVFNVSLNSVSIDGAAFPAVDANTDCRNLTSTFVFAAIDMVPFRTTVNFKIDAKDKDTVAVRYDSLDQLGSYRGRFVIDKRNLQDVMISKAGPVLSKFSVTSKFSKDKADKLMVYCAGIFGISKEDYLNKVVASPKFSNDSFGVDIGSQARFGLAAFLNGDSELTARFDRFGELNNLVTDLSEDSIWHAFELNVDDVQVPLEIPDVETVKIEETISEIADLIEPSSKEKLYVDRDIVDATNYIGHIVRIERTKGRRRVQGRLLGESLDGLIVKVYHPRGDVTLNIDVADTESFSVLQEQ